MGGWESQLGPFSCQCHHCTSRSGIAYELIRNVEWQVSPKPTESETAFKQNLWVTPEVWEAPL